MSPAAVEFVLVRHGETDYNAEGRLQGAAPPGPPLNARGWAQAEAVRCLLHTRCGLPAAGDAASLCVRTATAHASGRQPPPKHQC
jgi:broad specificity phosphatase PhoE